MPVEGQHADDARSWVDEDITLRGDDLVALGTFTATLETGSPSWDSVGGPSGVTLAEALRWARAQAAVVIVRIADEDTSYSAGVRTPAFPPGHDDEERWVRWDEDRPVPRVRALPTTPAAPEPPAEWR